MELNQHTSEMINELAELCGIIPEYWDIFGKRHVSTVETKLAMLRAMKLHLESEEDIAREIDKQKKHCWRNITEPVFVVSVNSHFLKFPVHLPVAKGQDVNIIIEAVIEDEKGATHGSKLHGAELEVAEESIIDGSRYIKFFISAELPSESGFYTLSLKCRLQGGFSSVGAEILQKSVKLIVTPDTAYIPPDLESGKAWGVAVNLYALHSDRSWGIGDFGDLKTFVGMMSLLKADFIGINPLHAIPNTYPYGVSPYSPLSRLYKNFIYLDVDAVPEVMESQKIREFITKDSFRKKLLKLRKSDRIDYEGVARLKDQVLRRAFVSFYENHYKKMTRRSRKFRKFMADEGISAESFATFQALWHKFNTERKAYSWQQWPDTYHNPEGESIVIFRKKHNKEILYYIYLQWLIDEQLMQVALRCNETGIKTGMYQDLAIGAVAGGSDVWNNQRLIGDADVGAPPDDFTPQGQNWGFPPLIPERLREGGYELFIEAIRKNMKYGGALRIDHALGLYRLFWIPSGMSPKEGAYLRQPAEDLLRIIALESHRNRTIVIAEDLGTIDDDFREMLRSFQMLSYRLFYFERNYPDPSFKSPEKYIPMALCAITTHDLPTIYGYWTGRDIEVKRQLGIYADDEAWERDVRLRERDKGLILSALKTREIVPADFPDDPRVLPHMTHELCLAIYRYLGQSPCKLLLVSLDDIVGTLDQQNMPGTVDSHPNWIQKSPQTLEEIMHDEIFSGFSCLPDK
jgi:4-alpha-glucanotransferase